MRTAKWRHPCRDRYRDMAKTLGFGGQLPGPRQCHDDGCSVLLDTLNTYGYLWPDANDRTRQAARDLYRQATAYPLRTAGT
jgi:hypothetical protein